MKKHYYMVSSHLSFLDTHQEAEQSQIQTVPINVISAQDKNLFSGGAIAQAQRSTQLEFFSRMADHPHKNELIVVDVFVLSISYLGHMTAEEFVQGTGPDNATAAKVADVVSDVVDSKKALN